MPATIPLEASRQGSDFYAWSFPGAPVQVHLYFEVVQGIRQCLKQAFATGESSSVRGLLLGKVNTPGLPEITGFRPLSTANAGELEAAIDFFKNSGNNLLPLGYFRAHTEEHLSLAPDDLSLAQAFFSDPNCVFLLVQPTDTGAANGGFFFWDRGKMNGGFYDFCFLEFPFDVYMLSAAGPNSAKKELQSPTDSTMPEPLPVTADPTLGSVSHQLQADVALEEPQPLAAHLTLREPLPLPEINAAPLEPPPSSQNTARNLGTIPSPSRSWRTSPFVLSAILLTMASLAAGIFLFLKLPWMTGSTKSPDTTVALKVERQGTDLTITWNHNSPLVTRADTGRLTVYDGAPREFPLDKNQIRSGSVVYSPVTDQVRVQLDLQTPDRRIISESVMVILNRSGTTDSAVAVQPVAVRPPRPLSPAPFDAGNAGAGSPHGAKVLATREFLAPQERAAEQPQPPELAPPPPVAGMNSAPAAVLSPALSLPHSQPPPVPKVASTSDAGAQPPASTQPPERPSPIGTPNSDYVPPVPIRQLVPPPLTPLQRSLAPRTVVVEIKVFIDASGNVRKTERLNHANPVLATAAESVAKLWTFHPARRAGQAVPSEMTLQFKFDGPK